MFSYCENNPVNKNDSDGNLPAWARKVLIGTAVIAAAAVLTVATAGTGTALACFAVGALKGAAIGAAVGAATGAAAGAVGHRISTGSWQGSGQATLEGAAAGYMTGAISGFVSGGFTSNVCFVAGTSVLTAAGYVAIEDVQVGDLVMSWNEETGQTELKPVAETYINETSELTHVFVASKEIVSTPSHPFYSPVKGWTAACKLRAGDVLQTVNGEYVVVEWVQHELLESPIKVYNFQVEDDHNYYVSDDSILVHNACKPSKSNYRQQALEYYDSNGIGQQAHHIYPQKFESYFSGRGINIHSPQNIRLVGSATHQSGSYAYNQLWEAFINEVPDASYGTIKIAGKIFMDMVY